MKKRLGFALPLLLGALGSAVFAQGTPRAGGDGNKTAVRRVFHQLWNEGNFAGIEQLFVAKLPFRVNGRLVTQTPEDVQQAMTRWRTAFPDIHFTIEDIIAERDRVAVRVTFTGTHRGEWWGVPPSERRVQVTLMMFFRIENGRLMEAWENYDEHGLRRQLGLSP